MFIPDVCEVTFVDSKFAQKLSSTIKMFKKHGVICSRIGFGDMYEISVPQKLFSKLRSFLLKNQHNGYIIKRGFHCVASVSSRTLLGELISMVVLENSLEDMLPN